MPTFQNMRRGSGSPGIVAIPGRKFGAALPNYAAVLSASSKSFRSNSFSVYNAAISGVTKDSTGATLGNCVVDLIITSGDLFATTTTSDASGNFTIYPTVTGPFYIVAYKAGSPDVAGTTVNTLTPV
jgi:hypothetical protein